MPAEERGQLAPRDEVHAVVQVDVALHAYYPSHRNSSRAMRLVIDAIRFRQ